MSAAVSPNGRWIAIDLLGALWIVPIDGGDARKISPDLLEARQPTWSPDNESLAFQGYDDGSWHIYTMSREGERLRRLTKGVFDDCEPAWSHDGSRIAFSSDRVGGTTTIWTVSAVNGAVAQASTRDGWMPTWSAGDREITFISSDRGRVGSDPTSRAQPGVYAVGANGQERLILRD